MPMPSTRSSANVEKRFALWPIKPNTPSVARQAAGNEVFVNGHVEARAQVECDRCLKPVEIPVNTDFELEYISGSEYESSAAAELTEAEMSVSVFDDEAIDVDEIVKEQILLAVPTRMLCREDCKGICPQCGIDRNTGECNCVTEEVDPRWAALKNLK